jgi:hypothetical protein
MRVSFLLRVGIIVSIGVSTLATAQLRPDQLGGSGEWLSWAPEYRNAYAAGLISGYMMGFYRACALANQLFEQGKPHKLGHDPEARCMAHRGEFSKKSFDKNGQFDVSAYTDVVTAFYRDHPSCQEFPFDFLLQSLSANYATADQLYEMALNGRFELYGRSRQWCGGKDVSAPKP